MQVDVALILDAYKEELNKLINDNVILRAQIQQLQKELEELSNDLQKGEN